MNNNDRAGGINFLRRTLAIPAWLLILIAVVALVALLSGITIPTFGWVLIVLLLIVMGWFPGQGRVTSKELPGLAGHTITVSNFPPTISPELLDMSEDDLDTARKHTRDGVGEILTIAGNLVFYDQKRNLVNTFSTPVRLTFDYTKEDEDRAEAHRRDLINNSSITENMNVEIIPVYLYTYPWNSENPTLNIWKPFQTFSIDKDRHTMTIEFRFWGDRPISPGTQP